MFCRLANTAQSFKLKYMLSEYDASIAICSDSQAALKALDTAKTTSKLVAETTTELKRSSLFNSVRLIWVPGHFNVPGNEIADKMDNNSACEEFIGPEPSRQYEQKYGHWQIMHTVNSDSLLVGADKPRCFKRP